MLTVAGVQITWLGHDGFKLKADKVVYLDPYQLVSPQEAGDVVCISHEHFDHLSLDDLRRVVTPATTVVTTAACEAAVQGLGPGAVRVVAPGDRLEAAGVPLEIVAAYNTSKFREPGKPFHPKADGKVGFLVTLAGVRIYHAGDTDQIPEMAAARGVDVALLPVSGTYVMTAAEAAAACRVIQPKLAIPMHYGSIVGSASDAEAFRRAAACRVEVLTPEA
jgi:L-ascorbate metabolism protein UlaG (beta-lactamase superfamily)